MKTSVWKGARASERRGPSAFSHSSFSTSVVANTAHAPALCASLLAHHNTTTHTRFAQDGEAISFRERDRRGERGALPRMCTLPGWSAAAPFPPRAAFSTAVFAHSRCAICLACPRQEPQRQQALSACARGASIGNTEGEKERKKQCRSLSSPSHPSLLLPSSQGHDPADRRAGGDNNGGERRECPPGE